MTKLLIKLEPEGSLHLLLQTLSTSAFMLDSTSVPYRDLPATCLPAMDVYSRKTVGVATRSTMRTDALPMEALEHALTTARRIHGNQLIHHSDRGSQYVSLKYSSALAQSGIRPSVGTVGDSYDNALAETVNGLYKAELIHAQGPCTSVGEVELATLRWVHW